MSRIAVAGLWHQGSVVSACLAHLGHAVVGVAEDPSVVANLNRGVPPVYEPGLSAMIRRNIRAGRLQYTASYPGALRSASLVFIALDTPVKADDAADLEPILRAARNVREQCRRPGILCISAQVPLGTCDLIERLVNAGKSKALEVAYVPEFLRLGTALSSFLQPDRIIIGADAAVAKKLSLLYKPLRRPILTMDRRAAEMAKHASNAYLATSISFSNEISDLCERHGADIRPVLRALQMDRRIGPHAFLSPGLGFAGGTLGREIRSLQQLGKRARVGTPLLDAVWKVNRGWARVVPDRLRRILRSLKGKRIGILGLTYKPGTSTMRRAISLQIMRNLLDDRRLTRAGFLCYGVGRPITRQGSS